MKNLPLAAFALATCLLGGCSDIYTDYGQSKGLQGRKSVNGFGALRSAYEQAGFRSRDVTRLSDRVRRTDVIVWTPKALDSVDDDVTRWFDRWLRQGGRTLVYVVPDSGSEADYWIDAARLAPPDQRLEYRLRAGRCMNERLQWRLNRSSIGSNGWFRVEPLEQRQSLQRAEGPWKETWPSDREQEARPDNQTEIELRVVAYDSEESPPPATTPPANRGVVTGSTGPGSSGFTKQIEVSATNTPVEFTPLLSADSENPVIAEVRSPNWQDSKIIVVAGGSLLTNYAFSREPNQRLADQIIAESIPSGVSDPLAGFLTSDWTGIQVSERQLGTPQSSGMEMLSEWPISMVTMHGVILGFVVCLMLLPIFGRPRRVRRSETNDFGHHLDAVAALMKRSGGESYARGRISDYFKRMHGETEGRWVLPESSHAPPSSAVPKAASKQLRSTEDPSGDAESSQSTVVAEQSTVVAEQSVDTEHSTTAQHFGTVQSPTFGTVQVPSSDTVQGPEETSQDSATAMDPKPMEPPKNQDEADH